MDIFTKKSKPVKKDVEEREVENEEEKRSWFGSKKKKAAKKEDGKDSDSKTSGMTVEALRDKLKGVRSQGFLAICQGQIKNFDKGTPPDELTKLGKRID